MVEITNKHIRIMYKGKEVGSFTKISAEYGHIAIAEVILHNPIIAKQIFEDVNFPAIDTAREKMDLDVEVSEDNDD